MKKSKGTSEEEEKEEEENILKPNFEGKLNQKNKYLRSLTCKILWTLLKMDQGGTRINGLLNEEMDNDTQNITSTLYVKRKERERELFTEIDYSS